MYILTPWSSRRSADVKKKNTKPCVKTSEPYVKLSTVAFVSLYHDITLKKKNKKNTTKCIYKYTHTYIYIIILALFMEKNKK